MVLPFLEVSHLPSSSSFYSAIVQPLGLRYLSNERGHFPSITYGDGLGAVFQLRQVAASRDRPLKVSHLALSAPSPEAADDAYDCAVRASPDDTRDLRHARSSFDYSSASGTSATRTLGGGGKVRINITDFDGNTMAVVYRPPPEYGDQYGGSTVRRTQSTPKEASRILDWNYDVVSSELPPPSTRTDVSSRTASRRPYETSSRVVDEPYSSLRRSMTEGTTPYEPTSPRQTSSGFNTGTVVGALLGVAAGAVGGALAYSKYKSDRPRGPRQDYDMPPPSFTRRSTFPDPYPDRKERYVDPEHEMSRIHYPEDYAPVSEYRAAPEYVARYSQAGSRSRDLDDHYSKAPSRSRDLEDHYSKAPSRSREAEDYYSKAGSRSRDYDDRYSKAPSRSRDYDDYEDVRGRHVAPRSRASTRARSATASHRDTLLLDDKEYRSQAGSRSSRHPPIVQRSYTTTYEPQERDSYVSAKTHRSSNTLRGGPPRPGESAQMVSRSRSGSRMTTTTVRVGGNGVSRAPTYVSARGVPLPPSRANTYISAREVPLPSSQGGWEDDDTGSVVPEDSISCVGIGGRGGRRYH